MYANRKRFIHVRKGEMGEVTVGDLLWLCCFFDPILASIFAAIRAHMGIGGCALALLLGLLTGFASAWIWRKLLLLIWSPRKWRSEKLQDWCGLLLHLGGLPWVALSMFASAWWTSKVLGFRLG